MKSAKSQSPELRVLLEPGHAELVRTFVRETSLSEGVSPNISSLIAEDTAQIWQALCPLISSGANRVSLQIQCSRKDVSSRLTLHGHAQFSKIADGLGGLMPAHAGISWRERGIDGWEVTIHRSLIEEFPIVEAMGEEPSSAAAPGVRAYKIGVPQREDAPAIARCFLAVYGHAYVHPEVFAPSRYWDKVERGELVPVVARNGEGEIVGHLALERGPGTQVAERGEAVVLPAHRGRGLLERMTDHLSDEALKHDLEGVYAEPVTVHTYSQRNDERAGMPVCAVLLGVNPDDFRPKGQPSVAGQRQSYLRTFRFLRAPVPRTIYAPEPYREVLHRIYASLGTTVTEAVAPALNAPHSRTSIKVNGRSYGVIAFEQIGMNAAIELDQALRDVRSLGARSVQLSAPVDDPELPILTEAARNLGFFFCGLGPAFADGRDLFLLQLLSEPLDTGKLQFFTDLTKDLVAFIDSDRARRPDSEK